MMLLAGVFCLALAARLLAVRHGGGLHGMLGYDDGVYFSAATALVSGRLPYRDFTLLHPPGIAVALAPFGLLARGPWRDGDAFALARLAFMGIGAVSAVLAGLVVRRLGRVAAVTAGVCYAVWTTTVYAERTTTLETLVNLGVLLSVLLVADGRVSRRRLFLAGAAMGFAVSVKLWAVVPLLVVLFWLLVVARRRSLAYLNGAVVAGAVLLLPFFLAAPSTMFRMVVLDQIGRPRGGTALSRLANITGISLHQGPVPGFAAGWTVVCSVVLAAGVVVALRRSETRLWGILLVTEVATLLAVMPYFPHYGSFAVPGISLVAGTTAAAVVGRARERIAVDRSSARAPRRPLAWGVVVVAGPLFVVVATPAFRMHEGHRVSRATFADLDTSGCISADTPEALVLANRLSRDLVSGCPYVGDVSGRGYDLATLRRHAPRWDVRRLNPAWQEQTVQYLRGGALAFVARRQDDGFSRATDALIRRWHRIRAAPGVTIYRPPG